MKRALVLSFVLLSIACVRAADSDPQLRTITLQSGGTLQGYVRVEGDTVYVNDGSGDTGFERSHVVKIEPVPEKEQGALLAAIEKRRDYVARKSAERAEKNAANAESKAKAYREKRNRSRGMSGSVLR